MYKYEYGVAQDLEKAYVHFSLADALGHPEASESKDQMARWMKAEQVADSDRIVKDWLEEFNRRNR
jgi:TPR repeat protein